MHQVDFSEIEAAEEMDNLQLDDEEDDDEADGDEFDDEFF